MTDDVRIIREAIAEIERHTGWRSDERDEEPYPATDDDYRRVVLASDLHKLAERMEHAIVPPKIDELHLRKCWDCGTTNEHQSRITPGVLCPKCGSQDTRAVKVERAK